MQPSKVYDEVIEFIASSNPQNVIAFRPSEEVKARVADLMFREKTEGLLENEKFELDHYHDMLFCSYLSCGCSEASLKTARILFEAKMILI